MKIQVYTVVEFTHLTLISKLCSPLLPALLVVSIKAAKYVPICSPAYAFIPGTETARCLLHWRSLQG